MEQSQVRKDTGLSEAQSRGASTTRGVPNPVVLIISFVVLFIFNWFGNLSGLAHLLPEVHIDVPSRLGLLMVLVLLVLNLVIGRLGKGFFGLKQRDIVAVYMVISMGYIMGSLGFVHKLIFSMMWPQGILLEEDAMSTAMTEHIGRFSKFVMPGGSDEVIWDFYLGGANGVPWSAWIVPLAIWLGVSCLFVFGFLALATLVYERWANAERLTFPLALPVLELSREAQSFGQMVTSNKLLIFGAAIPFFWSLVNVLHTYYPGVPYISHILPIGSYFAKGPFKALSQWPVMQLDFRLVPIGLMYFIPLDVSFSVWFFYLCQRAFAIICDMRGITSEVATQAIEYHNFGSAVGLLFVLMLLAKNDIREIISKATGKTKVSNVDMPMSYRLAVFGGIACVILLTCFFRFMLGVDVWVSLLFIFLFATMGIVFARVRSETGVPMSFTYFSNPKNSMTGLLGSSVIGEGNLAGLGFIYWAYLPSVMAFGLEGYKMADETNMKKSAVTKIVFLTFVAAFIFSFSTALPLMYDKGATAMDYYRYESTRQNFKSILGVERDSNSLASAVTGGLIVGLLMILRTNFIWWPLHPMGYLMGWSITITWEYWGPFFVGWLIKFLVFRYGGFELYKKSKPFFIGLIVGGVVFEGLSYVITSISGIVSL
jgi:hypothetical protein